MSAEIKNDDEVRIKQRTILWFLVFIGFSVNYLIRININIALIDMLDEKFIKSSNSDSFNITKECVKENKYPLNISKATFDLLNSQYPKEVVERERVFSIERYLLDAFSITFDRNGFHWNEKVQGQVLGSFYYLHFLLQLPGGILANRFGTKAIFGHANLIGCLLCSLMPLASYIDYRLLIGLKVLQGLICSLCWPSMHWLSANWIPKNERGRFVSSYLGSSFGVAIFYPIFGFIMKKYCWEYVFHFCSIFGIIWWILWQYFVYDSPNKHPRISALEKNYLNEALNSSLNLNQEGNRNYIPWKNILKCSALWINAVAQFGGVWGLQTILTQGPSYFRFIHGWDSTKIGIISGIPHFFRSLMAIIISQIMDRLLTKQMISRNNVRKVGTALCTIVNGVFIMGLAFSGCNSTMACCCIIIATALHGAVSSGPLSAIIDISPRYAGVLLGIVNMICALPGFISPLLVSYFTYQNQTIDSWKIVFIISALLLILTGMIYVIFADSSQQSWNNGVVINTRKFNKENNKNEEEMETFGIK